MNDWRKIVYAIIRGQEWSGMDQEWSGKIFLENCRVIAGNCCLKTKPMGPLGGLVRVNVNCHELTANWGEFFISIYGKFTEIRVHKKSLLSTGRTMLWSGIVGNGPGIDINILFKNYSWKIPVYYWAFLTTSTSACGPIQSTDAKQIWNRWQSV